MIANKKDLSCKKWLLTPPRSLTSREFIRAFLGTVNFEAGRQSSTCKMLDKISNPFLTNTNKMIKRSSNYCFGYAQTYSPESRKPELHAKHAKTLSQQPKKRPQERVTPLTQSKQNHAANNQRIMLNSCLRYSRARHSRVSEHRFINFI